MNAALGKTSQRDGERAGRLPVIVKAGVLAGEPAEQPDLVFLGALEKLVPAAGSVVPDQAKPRLRVSRRVRDDLGQSSRLQRRELTDPAVPDEGLRHVSVHLR